jgi:hypothetical protein
MKSETNLTIFMHLYLMWKGEIVDVLRHARCLLLMLCALTLQAWAQHSKFILPAGFKLDPTSKESILTITDQPQDVVIGINFPQAFNPKNKTKLIFFALPNGNSIEWTAGKKTSATDDWHYNIQHIAAQTRFLRANMPNENLILVYLSTRQKSWPAWKKQYPDYAQRIPAIIDSVSNIFKVLKPGLILNSHSGGGSFIFGYLDGVNTIPDNVERIAFIDSDYAYGERYARLFKNWLNTNKQHYLCVLAYNDSVVIYNGKPLVSPTGGTWYRSKLMQTHLAKEFKFTKTADTAFINYSALKGRIQVRLKENPQGLIYHTVQVERNGFIFSCISGTAMERKIGPVYWDKRVYEQFILE